MPISQLIFGGCFSGDDTGVSESVPFADHSGIKTWHIVERTDGSISIYYTLANLDVHFVVYDTLDKIGDVPDETGGDYETSP